MSSESDFAWQAARFYGPRRVQMSRQERVDFVYEQIALLENHLTSEQSERAVQLSFLHDLISSEEQDHAYALRARLAPVVNYKQHVDGFCSYWQKDRHRKFEAVGWKCERCGSDGSLDAHHLHYDTLGFEELDDLQALCPCHNRADEERAAYTRDSNAADTYMRKKYGDDYQWSESAQEEFDRWLERKQERGY